MRVLLDTVAFVFAIQSSDRLSPKAKAILANPSDVREVSAVSAAEIGLKNAIGKLEITKAQALAAVDDLQLKILPYTTEHALQLFGLPLHHRDPFDRMLIAQALAEDIPVITCDPSFRLYRGLTVIW